MNESGATLSESHPPLGGTSTDPFNTPPPAVLAANGYGVTEGDSTTYHAPDARVLLSDAFATTHCFTAVRSPSMAGTIGLAFAPVKRRSLPEVAGVL